MQIDDTLAQAVSQNYGIQHRSYVQVMKAYDINVTAARVQA